MFSFWKMIKDLKSLIVRECNLKPKKKLTFFKASFCSYPYSIHLFDNRARALFVVIICQYCYHNSSSNWQNEKKVFLWTKKREIRRKIQWTKCNKLYPFAFDWWKCNFCILNLYCSSFLLSCGVEFEPAKLELLIFIKVES